MPNGNSVMDAWGNQGSMFSGMGNGEEKPDNTMNITSQTIGNNYMVVLTDKSVVLESHRLHKAMVVLILYLTVKT